MTLPGENLSEMGKGSKGLVNGIDREIHTVTLDDVKKHDGRDDKWLVIQGEVYDITKWSKRHPGGSRLISHFAGQDATVSIILIKIWVWTASSSNHHKKSTDHIVKEISVKKPKLMMFIIYLFFKLTYRSLLLQFVSVEIILKAYAIITFSHLRYLCDHNVAGTGNRKWTQFFTLKIYVYRNQMKFCH